LNPPLTGEIVSLGGTLRAIFIPDSIALKNPTELGEALLAYRFQLSREDIRLLRLIMADLTNDQITERMHLAEVGSVKNRIESLFKRLGVDRRTGAALIGAEYGLRAESASPAQPNGGS